jgi:hypothetical protein
MSIYFKTETQKAIMNNIPNKNTKRTNKHPWIKGEFKKLIKNKAA